MSSKVPLKVVEIQLSYKSNTKIHDRPQVTCSREAYNVLEANWSDQVGLLEEFNILLLDRANRAMAMCQISKGGTAGTVVDLKIVFATAIKGCASCIILSHNHPSGNLRPSQADIKLTEKFKQAGELLEIPVLDHIIISPEGGYYSFADECML